MNIKRVILFLSIVCFFGAHTDNAYLNYSIPLATLIDSLDMDRGQIEILIDKSDYKLTLLAGEIVIKEYPVVFGGDPVGEKLMEGDQRTPEGSFKVRDLYPHKSWSKFIWLDYPTSTSWEKHRKAKADGLIPQNARIGGEIGIHGVPEGYDYAIEKKMNWTLGCISLKNTDVNEIFPYIFKNMPVTIRK